MHSSVFDLRALQVVEGTVIAAYLFPWAVLDEVAKLADASQYRVEVPKDMDPRHFAGRGGAIPDGGPTHADDRLGSSCTAV